MHRFPSWLALFQGRLFVAARRTRVLYAKAAGLDAGDLEAEHAASGMLQGRWHELEELAELTDAGLHTTKVAFAKATREQVRMLLSVTIAACWQLCVCDARSAFFAQVATFQAASTAFFARLHSEGPGTLAHDLPAGLDALRRFQGLAAEMAKEREQLVLAESLFDLEQTLFPELSKVWKETPIMYVHRMLLSLQRARDDALLRSCRQRLSSGARQACMTSTQLTWMRYARSQRACGQTQTSCASRPRRQTLPRSCTQCTACGACPCWMR